LFSSKVIVRTHTHLTVCFTWTTKVSMMKTHLWATQTRDSRLVTNTQLDVII